MKRLWIIIALLPIVFSCSDSGSDKPREKEKTSAEVTGIAAIGNITTGFVSAYDFSSCAPGEKLAEQELVGNGSFNLKITTKDGDMPVLLELSNFSYLEESTQSEIAELENTLYASLIIQPSGPQIATISYWTNLAHARTSFLCSEDSSQASQHVSKSNDAMTKTLLFDIIKTQPLQMNGVPIIFTDVETVSYGVANSAVSFYSSILDRKAGGTGKHSQFSSIDFAAMAYDDLATDNVLDGIGAAGQLSVGPTDISADTYRTELANDIYYALTVFDISPESRIEEISVIAQSINLSVDLDAYPEMTVTPVSEQTFPSINGVSYWDCPRYDSCNPVGCNVCWTIEGSDRHVPCEITMFLDIQDQRGIPFTVTGTILNGNPNEGPNQVTVGENDEPTFHIKFPFNQAGPNNRNIEYVVANEFNLSQTFTVNADARVPAEVGAGAWYNQHFVCGVSITSVGSNQ